MFSRLLAFIILVISGYVLLVFFLPEIADHYGNKEFNSKIRTIKEQSLTIWSWNETPDSLWKDFSSKAEGIRDSGQQFIDDSRKTATQIQSTIEEKNTQAQQAAESVEKAYDAVNTAKTDIERLTTFSWTVLSSGVTTVTGSIR